MSVGIGQASPPITSDKELEMKKCFEGIAVYPARVETNRATAVGVWIRQDISPRQREEIMVLNKMCVSGHISVRSGVGGTAVMFIGRIGSPTSARKLALYLIKLVAETTRVRSVVRELPNYRAVSRALAV